ncbi:hypothetical protein GCM10010435_77140 [Winogradskya consettensis]|uniref:Uncharacterized protein n=1 Tax=Winogradskya consettensis TaxID=113560 RepID=A0A919SM28_9ACTN|nr:hypothetical protein Aco04nite_41350 [Actinoplanes consettensis]
MVAGVLGQAGQQAAQLFTVRRPERVEDRGLLLVGEAGRVGEWVPVLGAAAAAGLVVYFACAVQTHLLARDYGFQFGLAIFLLVMNAGVLTALVSRTA